MPRILALLLTALVLAACGGGCLQCNRPDCSPGAPLDNRCVAAGLATPP
jgi:hypothetical protein